MSKKSTFLTALCGAVLGALVVGVIPAVGAPGDPLILGQNNNGGGQTTKATSNVGDGPGFQFTNNAGGVLAAARINTGCVVSGNAKFGCAPGFATDTRGLVKHFNSDYLDGLGGEDYQVIAAGNSTQEAGTGTGVLTADITAPRTGVIQALSLIHI